VRTSEGVRMQLVNVDRDLFLIPSLAIHMNRSVNDGYAYKVQRDLLPLYGAAEAPDLTALVAETAGISPESVIGHDLFVYNRQAPSIWGADREFMSSPRLDDLQCAFSSLCGFLESAPEESLPVHVVFDNEEIGSSTSCFPLPGRHPPADYGGAWPDLWRISGKATPEFPAFGRQRPRDASQLCRQVRSGQPTQTRRRRSGKI